MFCGDGSKHFECLHWLEFLFGRVSLALPSLSKHTTGRNAWFTDAYSCVRALKPLCLHGHSPASGPRGFGTASEQPGLQEPEIDGRSEAMGWGLAPVWFSGVSSQEWSVACEYYGCLLFAK